MGQVDHEIANQMIELGWLDRFQLQVVQDAQKRIREPFHLLVVELGFIGEEKATGLLAKIMGLQQISLSQLKPSADALDCLDGPFCQKNRLVPCDLKDEGKTLYIAMADPTDHDVFRTVRERTGRAVRPMVAFPSEIEEFIEKYYHEHEAEILGELDSDELFAPMADQGGDDLSALLRGVERLEKNQRNISSVLRAICELGEEKGLFRIAELLPKKQGRFEPNE